MCVSCVRAQATHCSIDIGNNVTVILYPLSPPVHISFDVFIPFAKEIYEGMRGKGYTHIHTHVHTYTHVHTNKRLMTCKAFNAIK